MSTVAPTPAFPARLVAYLNERFPAEQMMGAIPLFLCVYLPGQILAGTSASVNVDALVGFLALSAHFLAGRTFDDHQDFEHDNRHYAERVLQQGAVTLGHLKVLGFLCFALAVAGSIYLDDGLGKVTLWLIAMWVAVLIQQLSLLKFPTQFAWMEERRVLRMITITPLLTLNGMWVAQMGAKETWLPWSVGWVLAAWVVALLLLEIVRKSRAPEDQRPTVVDYTKPRVSWAHSLGLQGTVVVLQFFLAVNIALDVMVLRAVGYATPWAYGTLVAVTAVSILVSAALFVTSPTRQRAKTVAEVVAACAVVGQLVLVIAMLAGD